jgi:hypothetical protein
MTKNIFSDQANMKNQLRNLSIVTLAVLLCSCAATSVKSTWKSPDYRGGPVDKIAVLAVDERGNYRPAFESQFVAQLEQQGQPAFRTLGLLSLAEIRADKEAAAEKLRAAGADSILIVRLVDSYNQSTPAPIGGGNMLVTRSSGQVGGFEYYTVSTPGRGGMQPSLSKYVCLDTSLYDLKSEKKLWSCVTGTVLREESEPLEEIRPLVTMVLTALRADGLIR